MPGPSFSTFGYAFTGATLDTTLVTAASTGGSWHTATQSNDRGRITNTATTSSVLGGAEFATVTLYDLTNASVYAELVTVPVYCTPPDNQYYGFYVFGVRTSAGTNLFEVDIEAGEFFLKMNGGSVSTGTRYNAAVHKFFRIRHSSTTVTIEHATTPAGPWTNMQSVTNSSTITDLRAYVGTGTYAVVGADLSVFDNWNTTGVATVTSRIARAYLIL